jgi:pimeloyl-ACP methyl ester carboxylesterase
MSVGRGTGRVRVGLAVVLSALVAAAIATFAVPAVAAPGDGCREVRHMVSGLPGAPGDHVIAGTLCARPDATTVQLLVHGATYGRAYWDFPYQPERYSYVDAMNGFGLATLNVDLLGVGGSDHPPSVQITLPVQIAVVHELVQALRGGAFGQEFTEVVLVGHSLGTLLSTAVAATYPEDVDGLIATGISHGFDTGMPRLLLEIATHPANREKGRFSGLDSGYLTTRPGNRATHFYHEPSADPEVIALDEATKQTMSIGEISTDAPSLVTSLAVQAPVLAVLGDHDALSCNVITCSSPASPWNLEGLLYVSAASFQQLTVLDSGHDINLHPNAHVFYSRAAEWVSTVVAGTTP